MANYKLISQPTGTVITVNEGKIQCGIASSETYYDAQIEAFILAAQSIVEDRTWRSLLTQEWLFTMDTNEVTDLIEFSKCPIISVDSIHYINDNGDLTNFTDYTIDLTSEPSRIKLNSIPNMKRDTMNALQIEFTAGYSYVFSIERTVTDVDFAANSFTLANHGLKNSDVIEFHDTGTVTGISTGQAYYIVNRTSDTFKVSLTVNGSVVDIAGTENTYPSFKVRQTQQIPTPIKQAIKLLVGDYFTHREDSEYVKANLIPNGVASLLQPYTLNYFYR